MALADVPRGTSALMRNIRKTSADACLCHRALRRQDEHVADLGDRSRLSDQKALSLVTASARQHFELSVGFDTLGGGGDAEAVAEAGHRANDRKRILPRRKLVDE